MNSNAIAERAWEATQPAQGSLESRSQHQSRARERVLRAESGEIHVADGGVRGKAPPGVALFRVASRPRTDVNENSPARATLPFNAERRTLRVSESQTAFLRMRACSRLRSDRDCRNRRQKRRS